MVEDNSLPFEDWWAPWQVALITDRSRKWTEQVFVATDAVEIRTNDSQALRAKRGNEPPDAKIVPEGWDHEHCALCWVTISEEAEDQQSGYTDGSEWVCRDCYQEYIAARMSND